MGLGQVKTPCSLFSYCESSVFLNKCFLDCYKLLVNFQGSEKVDFEKFVSVLIAFVEERNFRGTYSASPYDVT